MELDLSTIPSDECPSDLYIGITSLLNEHVICMNVRKRIMNFIIRYAEACKANVPSDRLCRSEIENYEYKIDNLQKINRRYLGILTEIRKAIERRDRQIFGDLWSLVGGFYKDHKE